jgi:hypothetical protein
MVSLHSIASPHWIAAGHSMTAAHLKRWTVVLDSQASERLVGFDSIIVAIAFYFKVLASPIS